VFIAREALQIGAYPLMKMEQIECSETSAYKIQTPGNYPEESIQHSEQDESLKSRILNLYGEETARQSIYSSPIACTVFVGACDRL